MPHPLHQVDAFADGPFTGNPAAACVLDGPAEPSWMQSVAAEMNLSETAFVHPLDDGTWSLRWFTPTVEVELCGHATLATAHVLWDLGRADRQQPLRFQTRTRGELQCERTDDGAIRMNFPADMPEESVPPDDVVAAVGVEIVRAALGTDDWLFEVEDAAAVMAAHPRFRALASCDARGVIVTAAAEPGGGDAANGHDVVSRFFCPAVGVNEDPVTGSAHTVIGPWWAKRLGRDTLRCRQASKRGGTVGVRVDSDRVELTGSAVTVLRGELHA